MLLIPLYRIHCNGGARIYKELKGSSGPTLRFRQKPVRWGRAGWGEAKGRDDTVSE